MEELQIGEWVRTKDGQIDKIYDYKKDTKIYICEKDLIIDSQNLLATHIKDILKHSKNIIDLIKVGDIIEWKTEDNSYYGINEVINRFGTIGVYAEEYDACIPLNEIIIKKILTHEKYEKECYRIGE